MEMERDIHEEKAQEAGVNTHGNRSVLSSEADLADHHDEHDDAHEEHEHVDYSNFTKKQFAELLKELGKSDDLKRADRVVREIKPILDEIKDKERNEALERFIQDGGVADDFDYRGDEFDQVIDANLKLIRDKRTQYIRAQEEKKNDNYNKKLSLLEKLRDLVDSQDGEDHFEQFKALQREWKNTGSVPGAHAKTIWANYHALVDRFYDAQSIYFELKELDRKKNLEAKIELCVRAEKLVEVEKINDAIRELNELHHEFKHIGPVPLDEKEAVWQRFKAASDAVYVRRDEFLKTLQQELAVNLEAKNKLADEVLAFASFASDRIKEWNQKTKEILELQKKWEAVGGLPRNKAKEINRKFWSAFKAFFSNKGLFFKKLDEEREQNLKLKTELVQQAIELSASEDWNKTANELKKLQQRWKDIGPVPEKFRDKVFKEFKEACDAFFSRKRGQFAQEESNQIENLKQKQGICEQLEQHATSGTATVELLRSLEEQFNAIGFVPKKDISSIKNRYHEAVQKFVQALPELTTEEKDNLLLESQLQDLKNDPMADRKLFHKEQTIRKKIQKVENDIALWKNNLEFFGKSQNADKVREEFSEKIKEAGDHLRQLKQQLKMLRTVS